MNTNVVKLGELFEITSGGTPSRSNKEYYNNGNIPWVKTGDLKSMYLSNASEYITELGLRESSAKLFPEGTVLIAMYGATIGNCSILKIESSTNQACAAFKPIKDILPEFLYYYLLSIKEKLISLGVGGAQPNISISILKNIDIPMISLDKQTSIVLMLNKAQELKVKRKSQIDALDQLTQSVFLDMFGEPIKNPKSWDKTLLDEIGDWKSGGTPNRSNKEYFTGNIPWLSAGELNQLYTYASNESITEDAINDSAAKIIPIGSLLLGMYDTAALKSTINKVECSCNQAIAYSKLDESIVSNLFVYYCIQIGKDHYKRLQRGVRQKNLNLSMIKNISIICPPLELQKEFSKVIEKIQEQRSLLEKGLNALQNNFDSLMQRAFKGELFAEEKIPNQ